ncbi:hypothetical protein VULLAG_LOCUS2379 [Vulpes lagopus]
MLIWWKQETAFVGKNSLQAGEETLFEFMETRTPIVCPGSREAAGPSARTCHLPSCCRWAAPPPVRYDPEATRNHLQLMQQLGHRLLRRGPCSGPDQAAPGPRG